MLLGGNKVLMAANCPKSAGLVADLGYEVVPIDISEFQKREGDVTCLSVRLPSRTLRTSRTGRTGGTGGRVELSGLAAQREDPGRTLRTPQDAGASMTVLPPR